MVSLSVVFGKEMGVVLVKSSQDPNSNTKSCLFCLTTKSIRPLVVLKSLLSVFELSLQSLFLVEARAFAKFITSPGKDPELSPAQPNLSRI